MDAQEQIFGLMAIAKEHQGAVKAAIDALTAERDALTAERDAIKGIIQQAANDAIDGVAVKSAKALDHAVKPVIGRLSAVVQAATDAEGSMRNAGAWFAWKWVALAAGGLVGVCLVAYASLAWPLHQISVLNEEKAELQAEVAKMRHNIAALEKQGGNIIFRDCGGRLCIVASKYQGNAVHSKEWEGAGWIDDSGLPLVIPYGH